MTDDSRRVSSVSLHVNSCPRLANLKCLRAGLDDGGKDRFTLVGVCKHVRDLVQEAGGGKSEEMWLGLGTSN